jgi:hypothetical protein
MSSIVDTPFQTCRSQIRLAALQNLASGKITPGLAWQNRLST